MFAQLPMGGSISLSYSKITNNNNNVDIKNVTRKTVKLRPFQLYGHTNMLCKPFFPLVDFIHAHEGLVIQNSNWIKLVSWRCWTFQTWNVIIKNSMQKWFEKNQIKKIFLALPFCHDLQYFHNFGFHKQAEFFLFKRFLIKKEVTDGCLQLIWLYLTNFISVTFYGNFPSRRLLCKHLKELFEKKCNF